MPIKTVKRISLLTWLALAFAISPALVLSGCGPTESSKNTISGTPSPASSDASTAPMPKDTAPQAKGAGEIVVKIGTAAPLTGPQGHLGKDNENGTRMAIDDLNAQGVEIGGKKAKFELISEDDQSDPKTGTIVAQKLVDAGVNGVIGHFNSGVTIPASKIYYDAGIPQISPSSTNPKYTHQGFKTAFRVVANDIQQGTVDGEYAVKKLGAKRIAIIDDRTAYGQGLADEFEKAVKANGAEIVSREYTNDKATDFMAVLTIVKSKGADLLFYAGVDGQSGPMRKQMKRLAINAKFMTGSASCTPVFIKLAGDDAEGAYCSRAGVPVTKMPRGKAFQDRFNAKYGEIQNYAPYCYDAVNVLIAAMKAAGSAEPSKYLPELGKVEYDGVTAKISFDPNGDLKVASVTVFQDKNGKWEALETETVAARN